MAFNIDVYYDFEEKEFRIMFDNSLRAEQYQVLNREGRIYKDTDDRSVWIPSPEGLRALRSSSYGFVFCFKETSIAKKWCERVIVAKVYPDTPKHAYIVRGWKEDDWEKVFRHRMALSLAPVLRQRTPNVPPPSPGVERRQKQNPGFDVLPQQGSKPFV